MAQDYVIDLSKRKDILDEFRGIIDAAGEKVSGESTNDCYFNQEIRDKTVLMVGLGKNVRGSLQYILNELNHSDRYEGYEIYVRTSAETEPIVENYKSKNNWNRTSTVTDEKRYRELVESAKYMITEVYFPESWIKKPGQISINIWHGTPLKKLGLTKNSKNRHKDGIQQRNFIDADYLLYPNEYTRDNMLYSYRVSNLMDGQVLMLGYPRTGGMVEASHQDLTELKKRLAPNGEKIYAFMPTFKDYLNDEEVVRQSKELLDYLDANLRDDQILYVNLHHKVSDSLDYSTFTRIKKFPPDVDTYQLLATTEALLTDYSSVFFDYLALRRHIILYMNDYELYKEKRGVYMDLQELPFDKAVTKEEVLEAMNRGKTYDDTEAYQKFCAYDSENNAKQLCQLFADDTQGLNIAPIPKNNKYKVLLYSEAVQPGASTQLLQKFSDVYDRGIAEVYISCSGAAVDRDKSAAYPLLFENFVLGTNPDPHLTGMGKTILKMYQKKKISFDKSMEYLKYDYAIAAKRFFGNAVFDRVVIYDVADPQMILSLTTLQAPKTLFLSNTLLKKIQRGDSFAKDAAEYAAACADGVFVISEGDKKLAEKVWPDLMEGRIQLLTSMDRLHEIICNAKYTIPYLMKKTQQTMKKLSELDMRSFSQKIWNKTKSKLGIQKRSAQKTEKVEEFVIDLSKRADILEEFRNIIEQAGETISGESTNDCYFEQEIKEKTVLMVGLGKNVRGSLQYILNELNHSDRYEGYEIFVRTSKETEAIVKNYMKQNGWGRTKTVTAEKQYRRLLESAKYLITEVYFPESWIKKPGQVSINIWHGTPLKKLGLTKNSKNRHKDGIQQRNFIEADYLLYPNEYTRDNMLYSYRVSNLMDGEVLMLGYPRTGGMLKAAGRDLTELKKRLAPNGEKIYAFMPTFKDYLKDEEVVAQCRELLEYLDANLRKDQILYVNLHHKVSDSLDYSAFTRIKKFPADVDTYQLLAVTEALLTDYSSVFFDYLALRRHIILYMNDYELYRTKRGVYMDLQELPFDKAITKEEVLEAINRGKTYDDTEAYQKFCAYDSNQNAAKLCQLVTDDRLGLEIKAIPKNNKKKILLYSEAVQPGASTKLLQKFTQIYDRSIAEVYLGCFAAAVDQDKSAAYPMLFDNFVLGVNQDPHLTGMGKAILRLYQEKKLSFEKAMEYLKYDYTIAARRYFGSANYDRVVIYDVEDPQMILSLTTLQAPKTLFLSEKLLKKILAGDEFAKSAAEFAAVYSDGIYVLSEEDRQTALKIWPDHFKRTIQVVSGPGQLHEVICSAKLSEINGILSNATFGERRRSVVLLGNGASAQHYGAYFQKEGRNGRELKNGTGSNQCAALWYPEETEESVTIANCFDHPDGTFAGFIAARKVDGKWQWYMKDQTWKGLDQAEGDKWLFREQDDLRPIISKMQGLLILQAQWESETGERMNCGYPMFSNELMAHAFGAFEGKTYCNTKAAFENAVKNGYRYFEVDLSYTTDGRLVLCHGWTKDNCKHTGFTYQPDFADMTYARIRKMNVHGYPIMDAREFYQLVKQYPEFTFEIDFHNVSGKAVQDRVKALLEDFKYDKEALDRLLIQAYSRQMYLDMNEIYPFKHYQYLVGKNIDQLDEIIQFSLEHGICVLAFRANLAKPAFVRKINNAGIYVMCYTVNKSTAFARKLLDSGVATLCTDCVTNQTLQELKEEEKFGYHPFQVFYNSGTKGSIEHYSEWIEEGRCVGEIFQTPKGALEFKDRLNWENDGKQIIRENRFEVPGKTFAGWKMRVNVEGKMLWYCTDHCYHVRADLKNPGVEPYIFKEGESIPKWKVMPNMKLVMVAVWK